MTQWELFERLMPEEADILRPIWERVSKLEIGEPGREQFDGYIYESLHGPEDDYDFDFDFDDEYEDW